MDDTSLFQPIDLPPELAGVTSGLLAGLYEAVIRHGAPVKGVEIRRLAVKTASKTAFVTVVVPPSPMRSIMISRMAGTAMASECHLFLLADGLASWVRWDKSFTVDDIREFIAFAPLAEKRGDWKLPVDAVFDSRGKVVEAETGAAELLRRQFDRPEEVAIITDDAGSELLCRADDLPYIRLRATLTREVLRKHGVKGMGDLARLSPQEKAAIVQAINTVLKALDN